jgi:hypothetical protein
MGAALTIMFYFFSVLCLTMRLITYLFIIKTDLVANGFQQGLMLISQVGGLLSIDIGISIILQLNYIKDLLRVQQQSLEE